MADESKQEKGFSVRDRRTSQGREELPDSATGVPGPAEKGEPGVPPTGTEGERTAEPTRQDGTDPSIPRVDFSTFLLSLLSSVLIHLGDMPDPITGKVQADLASAKDTIDILDILKAKTQGNLNEEEDRLLRTATAELKWKYLDALKKNG